MTRSTPDQLFREGLITEDQYKRIELITSGKLVSVHYDLRSLLYLGVMLFTTGVGILVYENIGEVGHLVVIGLLIALTIGCFYYAFTHSVPYQNGVVKPPTAWYDYVVLLGSLLFISVQGYLQYRYDLFSGHLELGTLVNAIVFFYVGYRFDHAGVIALGITALASFFSISVTPQKWYTGDISAEAGLHNIAIIFGAALSATASFLDHKDIKRHFTFTYQNFSFLIFFCGAIAGLFVKEEIYGLYLLVIYAGCFRAWIEARRNKSFLFVLYAFIAAYIGTTYLLADTILREASEMWFLYFLLSSGGFVWFILSYRKLFKRE